MVQIHRKATTAIHGTGKMEQRFCEPGRHSCFFSAISVLIKEQTTFILSQFPEYGYSPRTRRNISAYQCWHLTPTHLDDHNIKRGRPKRGEKKKRNEKSSWRREEKEEEGGEKSRDLEGVQLSARDRSVSGSWQPHPDEETGWQHLKPGRESSTDGKERHSPNKTVAPGQCVGIPSLFPKAWDWGSFGKQEHCTRDLLMGKKRS